MDNSLVPIWLLDWKALIGSSLAAVVSIIIVNIGYGSYGMHRDSSSCCGIIDMARQETANGVQNVVVVTRVWGLTEPGPIAVCHSGQFQMFLSKKSTYTWRAAGSVRCESPGIAFFILALYRLCFGSWNRKSWPCEVSSSCNQLQYCRISSWGSRCLGRGQNEEMEFGLLLWQCGLWHKEDASCWCISTTSKTGMHCKARSVFVDR